MMTDEKEIKAIPKYSIVPKFWNSPTEVAAKELVASYDASGNTHINFIDEDGRLWKGLITDFVIIKNFPDQTDMDDFFRMKKEADDMHEKIVQKNKKTAEIDEDDRAFS